MVVLRAILNKSIIKFYENIKNIDLFFFTVKDLVLTICWCLFFKICPFKIHCWLSHQSWLSKWVPPIFFFFFYILPLKSYFRDCYWFHLGWRRGKQTPSPRFCLQYLLLLCAICHLKKSAIIALDNFLIFVALLKS